MLRVFASEEAMRHSAFYYKSALVVLIASITAGCSGHLQEESELNKFYAIGLDSETPTAGEPITRDADSGMVVHIDPNSGEIVAPDRMPVPGQVPQRSVDASKRTSGDLRETPSPEPGGGVMLHLDERFMTPLKVTVDAEGKVTLNHQSGMSDSDQLK
jgi:hypothetical protein